MKKPFLLLSVLTFILLASCNSEMEDEMPPEDQCVTENMSFQNDILPIFETNCNGCHGAAANFGGITLDNHASTKTVVDAARLIGSVSRDAGFSPMPQGGDKISDCDITKIESWVGDGAPNN